MTIQNPSGTAPFRRVNINLPAHWQDLVRTESYFQLDHEARQLLQKDQLLGRELNNWQPFDQNEFILAKRSAPEDDEGIWHDDGSRRFAFSMGLNLDPSSIQGGDLLLRKRNSDKLYVFPALKWGEMIIFPTGVDHYEHRVTKVTQGTRLILAGWCW